MEVCVHANGFPEPQVIHMKTDPQSIKGEHGHAFLQFWDTEAAKTAFYWLQDPQCCWATEITPHRLTVTYAGEWKPLCVSRALMPLGVS